MRAAAIRGAMAALGAVVILSGCQVLTAQSQPVLPSPQVTVTLLTPSRSPDIIPPATPASSPTIVETVPATSSNDVTEVCSPLEGVELKELPTIVTNPYDPPLPGHDDGHHGTDLSFYTRGELSTILGLSVHSVLAGQVAAALEDRPPYGNVVIVETPLEQLSRFTLKNIELPDPLAELVKNSNLQCPPVNLETGRNRSLYLLYAHMKDMPEVKIGQDVSCGQEIGQVGSTGASGNPHLHLEVRVGPSGVQFPAMAHYVNDATTAEMADYCAWRISGLFQTIDPFKVLDLFLIGEDPFPLPR